MNLNYDYSVPAHRIQPESVKSNAANHKNLMGTQQVHLPKNGMSPMQYGPGSLITKTAQNFNPQNKLDQSMGQNVQMMPSTQVQKMEEIRIPFKRDYEILFHETEPFKVNLSATEQSLTLMLFSYGDSKMWKGEFPADYLEDISRKTGREQTYPDFIKILNWALVCQDSNKEHYKVAQTTKHIFIDLLGYQDLQLLKARKGMKASSMSLQQSNNIDPQKAKKRYLILTYLEKFNVNDQNETQNSIKEEIEAENDKTHYPLPLSMIEIQNINSIKEQKISKAMMKQMIRQMGDIISQSNGSISQTQSSGFGMQSASQSMLNHTIKSDMHMSVNTTRTARRTAREFFSKDNQNHPSIEENKQLKSQIKHYKDIKAQTMGSFESTTQLDEETNNIKLQLDSYKQFIKQERERLLGVQEEVIRNIEMTKSEIDETQSLNKTMNSNFSATTENIEEIRRQLAETSIELEENRANFKKMAAKRQKEIEENFGEIDKNRIEEKKVRIKVNQLEQDLLHQIKRLDIICKSKGLPRPKKDHLNLGSGSATRTGGTYVSPYGRNRQSPSGPVTTGNRYGQNTSGNRYGNNSGNRFGVNSGSRGRIGATGSNNGSQGRPGVQASKFYNNNYTPPNRRPGNPSPGVGAGSIRSGGAAGSRKGSNQPSPVVTMQNQNRMRRNQVGQIGGVNRSPSMQSAHSRKSVGSGYGQQSQSSKYNRLYSPNGTARNPQGATQGYSSHSGVNRVRREGAVSGSQNAQFPGQINRNNSKKSIGSVGRLSGYKGNQSDRSRSDRSDNSAKRVEPHKNLMSVAKNSKFVMNTRTIQRDPNQINHRAALRENMMNQQDDVGQQNIDDKISKLQDLLKMAKGN